MAVAAAPLLETDRLELWLPSRRDIGPMMAIVAHPETARYLGREATTADHFARFSRNAGSWLLYGYGSFILRERDSGALIGNAGVFHSWRGLGGDFDDSPEAGWILGVHWVGRGFAHEAMTAALSWFESEHGRQRIVCLIAPGNAPSIRLSKRLGFAPLRDAAMPDGEAVRLFERAPAAD